MERKLQASAPSFRFSTVMLIDDTPLDNFINKKIIETSAFAENIQVHLNGLTAYEYLRDLDKETLDASLPDIIFVDLNMPVMDGFQFIKKFYTLPRIYREKCRIVILTSSVNKSDRDMARGIDPDIVFLNKPLNTEHLSLIM